MAANGNRRRWLVCFACATSLLTPALIVACSDDDEPSTPECPELPLFAVRELQGDAASAEAIAAYEKWKAAAATNEACVTAAGTAVIPDANFNGSD
jgi:hypothetical protein